MQVVDEIGVRIRADPEERRVAETDEARVAGQHHQRDAAQSIDEDEREVPRVVGQYARQQHQRQQQRDVPVALDGIAEEPQVLAVSGLERESHAQTRLRPTAPNIPCGRTASTSSSTTYAATSLNPWGR